MKSDEMVNVIAQAFGRMGVTEVQIGSTVIPTLRPGELLRLEGCGDTIRKGDIISYQDGPVKTYPAFVEAIFESDPDHPEVGPTILTRRVDDGPIQKQHFGETSFCAWGLNWRCSFKRLTQNDLNRWFEETKAHKSDGWHPHPNQLGGVEFRTLAGVPVEVKCGTCTFKHAAEEVGRVTGYDIKLSGRFNNKQSRTMLVVKAERRKPPVVPPLFIVRHYDMFDGWMDLTGPLTQTEADAYWNQKTDNGTRNTEYNDGDYYRIFPADTRMMVTAEYLGR